MADFSEISDQIGDSTEESVLRAASGPEAVSGQAGVAPAATPNSQSTQPFETGVGTGFPAKSQDERWLRVRNIRLDDREAILPMVRANHGETVMGHLPFSEQRYHRLFDKAVGEDPASLWAVAMLADRPVGYCGVHIAPYLLSDAAQVAMIQTIYVLPAYRTGLLGGRTALRLIAVVRKIATERGATHFSAHVTSGVATKSTDRLLRRAGMRFMGGNYWLELNNGAV